ncbi:MAG: acetyltransferase [Myxococcales bacterium]|nr:acetyltransferase [Myxococcales bacterium]|tara:strand:- start:655 stop:1077 length:423 start_codon:yes stop_codon:yes gene_type:complete
MKSLPDNPYNPMCWIIGEPTIGQGCWIGAFTLLDGSGGLTIGEGTEVSSGAQILTHSSARRTVTDRAYEHVDRKATHIGKHVFIGTNATVLMGARVGDHSIIGAGAVVTEDMVIPPYSVAVGVPAKVVKRVDYPELDAAQ